MIGVSPRHGKTQYSVLFLSDGKWKFSRGFWIKQGAMARVAKLKNAGHETFIARGNWRAVDAELKRLNSNL